VAKFMDKQSPPKLAEYLFGSQAGSCAAAWKQLGELLVSWICAFKRARA
jgi:hypothetical protein